MFVTTALTICFCVLVVCTSALVALAVILTSGIKVMRFMDGEELSVLFPEEEKE